MDEVRRILEGRGIDCDGLTDAAIAAYKRLLLQCWASDTAVGWHHLIVDGLEQVGVGKKLAHAMAFERGNGDLKKLFQEG